MLRSCTPRRPNSSLLRTVAAPAAWLQPLAELPASSRLSSRRRSTRLRPTRSFIWLVECVLALALALSVAMNLANLSILLRQAALVSMLCVATLPFETRGKQTF